MPDVEIADDGKFRIIDHFCQKGFIFLLVYREISDAEKGTCRLMAQRNAINDGFERFEVIFLNDLSELEANL